MGSPNCKMKSGFGIETACLKQKTMKISLKKIVTVPFLTILLMLSLTTCKKDKSENSEFPGTCFITSIGLLKIDYSPSNKPIRIMVAEEPDSELDTVMEYQYNSSGKIATIHYTSESSYDEYDSILYDESGRVAFCRNYLDGQPQGTAAYHYNETSQLVEVTLSGFTSKGFGLKQRLISGTVRFEYDALGNVTKETTYSGGQVIERYEYTYDNMRNPYKEWNLPEGFGWWNMSKLLSKNNFTKEIYFNSYGSTTTTTNAIYEYNSNGYPVNMLLTGEETGGNYPATYQCI